MRASAAVIIGLLLLGIPTSDAEDPAQAWNLQITGSLGELSSCFAGGPPASGTNCNVFVGRTLEQIYGVADFKTGSTAYMLANEIADFLVTAAKWTLVGKGDSQATLSQAANSANSVAVVAVWKNPTPGGHGHVALIGPGLLQMSGTWALNVPNSAAFSMDSVNGRYIGDKLSRSFGADKKSSVFIYARLNP